MYLNVCVCARPYIIVINGFDPLFGALSSIKGKVKMQSYVIHVINIFSTCLYPEARKSCMELETSIDNCDIQPF
jgi:hypothetical protein